MNGREEVTELLQTGVPQSGGGQVTGHPPLVLAPMAEITHAAFRILVHEFGGCDLYFTEMISAEALIGGTPFEQFYRSLEPCPRRTIYQVVGYSMESIVGAVRRLREEPCAGIDINLGCSAPHLVRKGAGVAWMARPDETAELVHPTRQLLPNQSLSVKLRLGRSDDPEALLHLTRGLAAAGADFVTLHPKRQKEGSARVARWDYVDLLRRELTIPVIGNGGVVDWRSYESRRGSVTSPRASAIMIGRGAIRAPWLFTYLRGREAGRPEMSVDLERVVSDFLSLLETHQPGEFWASRARRVYPYLFQNIPFGHSLGARLAGTHDYETGKRLVGEYFASHPDRRTYVERR